MLELLLAIEWEGSETRHECPCCHESLQAGHRPACELARHLEALARPPETHPSVALLSRVRALAYWRVEDTAGELRTRLACIGVAAADGGAAEPTADAKGLADV